VVGSPATALARLEELARTYAVDEVMLHPVAGAWAGADPRRSPARERTLELVAELVAGATDRRRAPEPARG
jgi:hypothetical protein